MKKVLAIGEALIDFIPSETGCTLDRVPSFTRTCGGAPANVAAAVSLLGGRSALLTKLGKDGFGDFIVRTLTDAGVDPSGILRTDEAPTSLAFVSLRQDGGRDFSFYRNPGADMLLSSDELTPDLFDGCGALHFCSVDLVECPMKEAHLKAIACARRQGAIISFDPNIRLPLWKDPTDCRRTVRQFLPYADLVKISDEESEFVTGIADPRRAAEHLLESGAKLVLLSMGKAGAMLYGRQGVLSVPAENRESMDTTGAGDCLIGAFLYRLAKENVTASDLESLPVEGLRRDLAFANRCAGISVSAHGAIPSYPTADHPDLAMFSEKGTGST